MKNSLLLRTVQLAICGAFITASAVNAPAQTKVIQITADGKGDFATIQAAVDSIPEKNAISTIIKIGPGTYSERVNIPRGKDHVALIGTGPDRTASTLTTGHVDINSASEKCALAVHSDDTWVENLTIENTAGPTAGPHGALYTDGKREVFENLLIKGWQDTLPIWDGSVSYFHHCDIWGSVDFVYSGGTGVLQDCDITQIRDVGGPLAAPSTPAASPYGLVFLNCRVVRGPGVGPNCTDLMRPWGPTGATAFINCVMDNVTEKGWLEWDGREKTCKAVEYGSKTPDGTPIDLKKRSPWVKILTDSEAASWTPETILGGWDPTKVKSPAN